MDFTRYKIRYKLKKVMQLLDVLLIQFESEKLEKFLLLGFINNVIIFKNFYYFCQDFSLTILRLKISSLNGVKHNRPFIFSLIYGLCQ
jgi:hypothetical protein